MKLYCEHITNSNNQSKTTIKEVEETLGGVYENRSLKLINELKTVKLSNPKYSRRIDSAISRLENIKTGGEAAMIIPNIYEFEVKYKPEENSLVIYKHKNDGSWDSNNGKSWRKYYLKEENEEKESIDPKAVEKAVNILLSKDETDNVTQEAQDEKREKETASQEVLEEKCENKISGTTEEKAQKLKEKTSVVKSLNISSILNSSYFKAFILTAMVGLLSILDGGSQATIFTLSIAIAYVNMCFIAEKMNIEALQKPIVNGLFVFGVLALIMLSGSSIFGTWIVLICHMYFLFYMFIKK